jgi:hypothetical protein
MFIFVCVMHAYMERNEEKTTLKQMDIAVLCSVALRRAETVIHVDAESIHVYICASYMLYLSVYV